MNQTVEGFQQLMGMAARPDGGYLVVWDTPALTDGTLTHSYSVQHYDASGARVGGETPYTGSLDGLTGLHIDRVPLPDGGYLQFQGSGEMRSGLFVQQFDAAGTPVGPQVELSGPAHSHYWTGLALANGNVALAWQPASSVGPGEISTAFFTRSANP